MFSIIGFLLVLGPLVVVHELGHYLFARLFNVKAEVFSIGFGPRIWSKTIGETEWRFSVFPLGGYVKLLGEDPEVKLAPEELARALPRQAPWKRFFIFFGGPLFNFLWAALVFMVILAIGEPQFGNYLGRVIHGTDAEKAGFVSGDEIKTVNGVAVKKFEDFITKVNESPNQPLQIEVANEVLNKSRTLTVTPKPSTGFNMYGEQTIVGEIDGILATSREAIVGISNLDSLAARAGIKTGDKITGLNGTKISDFESFEILYSKMRPGSEVLIDFSRGIQVIKFKFVKQVDLDLAAQTGVFSSEMFIKELEPKSPAEAAGIQVGDRLVSVAGTELNSFFALKDAIQHSGEKLGAAEVVWERSGKRFSAKIGPTVTKGKDALLKDVKQFRIGVVPMLDWVEPKMIIERTLNPFMLVYKGFERMIVFSWRNLVSIRKMISGDVSLATLGGPILIGKIAGESISRGLISFLTTMAVLSVGLGVLNILPIPVLDGGHLVLLGIESIRGKPLTLRQMEIIQQVGLSLILMLMVVVFKNDLSRLAFFN